MEEDGRRSRDVGFAYRLVKPIDLNKLDLLTQQGPLTEGTDSIAPVGVGNA